MYFLKDEVQPLVFFTPSHSDIYFCDSRVVSCPDKDNLIIVRESVFDAFRRLRPYSFTQSRMRFSIPELFSSTMRSTSSYRYVHRFDRRNVPLWDYAYKVAFDNLNKTNY